MRPLPLLVIASNLSFIFHALMAGMLPMLILHGLLLPLNVYRLRRSSGPDDSPDTHVHGSKPTGLMARSHCCGVPCRSVLAHTADPTF
jgi:hypothetical protein